MCILASRSLEVSLHMYHILYNTSCDVDKEGSLLLLFLQITLAGDRPAVITCGNSQWICYIQRKPIFLWIKTYNLTVFSLWEKYKQKTPQKHLLKEMPFSGLSITVLIVWRKEALRKEVAFSLLSGEWSLFNQIYIAVVLRAAFTDLPRTT